MRTWLRRHAQAAGDALGRLAGQPLAALFSVLVLATAIALPVLAAIALRTAGAAAAGLDTDPHVNVYLAVDASDDEARRVGNLLRSHPQAARVRFIPRDQALAELRTGTHLAEILASLDRNPLPHAFTVRVRSTDASALESMRTEWSRLPKVEQVVADFEWAQRLTGWVRFGQRLLSGIALLLAAAVAFIVGHLIRLQVLTRREEIEVSQLVGATFADVRRPFLYHGLLQGAFAGAAALALAWGATAWVGHELSALTPSYAAEFQVIFLNFQQAVAVVLAAAGLGMLGAWVAVRREIRRFSRG